MLSIYTLCGRYLALYILYVIFEMQLTERKASRKGGKPRKK